MSATIIQLPVKHRIEAEFRMATRDAQTIMERSEDYPPALVDLAFDHLTSAKFLDRFKK